MTCRECGRPLWDARYASELCESCKDRAAEERYVTDFDYENRNYQLKRQPGEHTARRLRDIPRGY